MNGEIKLNELDISQILDSFRSLLLHIDFRSVSIKDKGIILSTFRFTNDEFKVIKKRQELVNDIKFKHKDLKFQTEILKFEDLEHKWERISKHTWNLQLDKSINLNKSFTAPSRWVFSKQDYGKKCSIEILFNLSNPGIIHNTLELIAEDLKKQGIKDIYSVINRFHEIENFGKNNHLFTAFIIPFPLEIYFDTLSFYNNYFYSQFKFHKNLKNKKLYVKLYSSDKSSEYSYEIKLGTDSSSLTQLGNNIFQDEIYFRIPNQRFEELGMESRFNILMEYDDLGFIIDYENHLKTIIKKKSKYKSLIPKSVQEVFMAINSFDMSNIQHFRFEIIDYIKNFGENQEIIKKAFNNLMSDIDWLLTQNSKSILKDYSKELVNKNSIRLYSVFRDLLIIILHNSIYNNYIHDKDLENKANDVIVKFGLGEFDNYAVLIYEKKSLRELQLKINKFVEEEFHDMLNCINYSGYNNQIVKLSDRHLLYPKKYSKCELSLDSERFCNFHLYFNEPSKFKHNTIFITFNRPKNIAQTWEGIDEKEIDKISILFNRIFELKTVTVIENIFLPQSITSQLESTKDLSIISEVDSKWISQFRFKTKNVIPNLDFDFKNINIFIGKNNSGKSDFLTKCFIKIKNGVIFDYPERVEEFNINHPERLLIDMFYMPEKRVISTPLIEVQSLEEELKLFLESINNLRSESYLRLQGEESLSDGTQDVIWKIPDLLRLVDLCLIYESDTNNLSRKGKQIFREGKEFFKSLKRIYESWKYWIEKFLDITINPPQGTERGRRKRSSIKDNKLNTVISNWKWFGSGTQQLLNMIFLIEFLKYGPTINYNVVKNEVAAENYNGAFKHIYNERNCRILYIDEPEVSLHPGLQKEFFDYLYDASKYIQIFIATQSPFFLNISNFIEKIENDINLVLCLKSQNVDNTFSHKIIKKNEIVLIYDDIFEYSIREIANFFSLDNYYYLSFKNSELSYKVSNLKMIKKLFNFLRENISYKNKVRDLGRSIEDFETRMIQNCALLCIDPIFCELSKENESLEEVFFGQFLITSEVKNSKILSLIGLYTQFYNKKFLRKGVLRLNQDIVPQLLKKLEDELNAIKPKIIKKKSIIILQENLIPYSALTLLFNFAFENEILIVAGLEHITLESFTEYIKKLPPKLKKRYYENENILNLLQEEVREKEIWINQAIIIDCDKKFSFQIKNVPFYSNKLKENIPILTYPSFSVFKTTVGKIAIFICKDFLVNYPVIDKWMDKHEVDYAVIPSYTSLVNPFVRKFGELVNFSKNKNKRFFFVNAAEFSGSGMFCYENRKDYEPGTTNFFNVREEGIKSPQLK